MAFRCSTSDFGSIPLVAPLSFALLCPCPPFPLPFPSSCSDFTWEMVIVDDGSKDKTAQVAQKLVQAHGSDSVRLLKLFRNSGKGAAVRKGMMRGRGKYLLMADADGATLASDLGRLLQEMQKLERLQRVEGSLHMGAIAIGSRAHSQTAEGGEAAPAAASPAAGAAAKTGGKPPAEAVVVKRSALRRLLMWGFHTFISVLIGGSGGIQDTQCGFKLFNRQAARQIFSVMHIERWAFDVEMIYLAARKGMAMVEVPVTWHEVGGSKVSIVSDSLKMARDIVVIRACYMLGLWKDTAPAAIMGSGGPDPAAVELLEDPSPDSAPVPVPYAPGWNGAGGEDGSSGGGGGSDGDGAGAAGHAAGGDPQPAAADAGVGGPEDAQDMLPPMSSVVQ